MSTKQRADRRTDALLQMSKELRDRGLSSASARGLAISRIAKDGFDWKAFFPPTANDLRLLAQMEETI